MTEDEDVDEEEDEEMCLIKRMKVIDHKIEAVNEQKTKSNS